MCKYNSDKGCLHGSAGTSCTVMLHLVITLVMHIQGELLALRVGRGRHLSCFTENTRLTELLPGISVSLPCGGVGYTSILLFLQEAGLNTQGGLSVLGRVFLLC